MREYEERARLNHEVLSLSRHLSLMKNALGRKSEPGLGYLSGDGFETCFLLVFNECCLMRFRILSLGIYVRFRDEEVPR